MLDTAPRIADDDCMAKRQLPLSDQIRRALTDAEAEGITRYQISKATAIDQASLSKFLHGERGLSLDSLDALAAYLDLQIVRKPKGRK